MITFSVEQLVHFNCSLCLKWWSIGDYTFEKTEMICPHCGKLQPLNTIEVGEKEKRLDIQF